MAGLAVERFKVTGLALLVLACGMSATYAVEIVGRVYLAEILLPIVAVAAAMTGRLQGLWRQREFRILMLALMAMLCGYVASDLVADTPQARYLRGWGRVMFVVTDFLSLAVIVAADRRNLRWFVLGLGIGGLAITRFLDHLPLMSPFGWKFGYGPAAIFALAATAYAMPRVAAAGAFAFLGALSMYLDARSYSALCMLIGALLWTSADRRGARKGAARNHLKLALGAVVALAVVFLLLKLTEDSWTEQRRAQSSVGRFVYIEIGARAILGSPLIGYGSWGRSREIAAVERQVFTESNNPRVRDGEATGEALSIHSQILQAWLEGGLGAGLFFLVYGWLLLGAARYAVVNRTWDALSPMMIFISFNGLWHLVMSPFSAVHRVDIALACTVIVATAMERQMSRRFKQAGLAPAPNQFFNTR